MISLRLLLRCSVFCVAISFIGTCASPADPPLSNSEKQNLTPERAKSALLEMMRSKEGKKVGWFGGNIPDEMAKMKIEPADDGWFAWTSAFRFQPSKAIYIFVVRPKPGAPGCEYAYEGSFIKSEGEWSATPPKLVQTVLQRAK